MTPKERILALAEKIKNPPSWWWKVLGGVILFVMVIWIGILLSQKAKALAAVKNEIAKHKLEAEAAITAAKVETDINKRRVAEFAATETLKKIAKDEAALVQQETDHNLHLAQLNSLANKDWTMLNKLAGVTPWGTP